MQNRKDTKYHIQRAYCRLLTWYSGDENEPPIYQLLGFHAFMPKEEQTGVNERVTPLSSARASDFTDVVPTLSGGRSFMDLFGPNGPSVGHLLNGVKTAEENWTRLCGRCRHPFHSRRACGYCGEGTCIEYCSRCLHEPHPKNRCQKCNHESRAHCIDHCPRCRHPGTMDIHTKEGCGYCPSDVGCNTLQDDTTVVTSPEGNDHAIQECGLLEDLRGILDIAESRNPEFFSEITSILDDAPGTDDVVRVTQCLLEDTAADETQAD